MNNFIEKSETEIDIPGPLGPPNDNRRKTPINYFIKLRNTFKDSSRSVDYLMRLTDEDTGMNVGRTYVLIFQMILLKTLNTFGYLCDILGNRNKVEQLRFVPTTVDILVYRFKGFFTRKELSSALELFVKLNKVAWSEKYQTYYVVDFMKHCGREIDYNEYRKKKDQT